MADWQTVRYDPSYVEKLDPEIIPLCDALNATGFVTTDSCSGHGTRWPSVWFEYPSDSKVEKLARFFFAQEVDFGQCSCDVHKIIQREGHVWLLQVHANNVFGDTEESAATKEVEIALATVVGWIEKFAAQEKCMNTGTIGETSVAVLDGKIMEILRPKDPSELQEALKQQMPEARTILGQVRKLVPLRDIVHVRRLAEDTMNLSETIIIPTVGQEKPMVGLVLAVGKGRLDNAGVFHPCEVEIGDVVLFGRYSGTEHKINGETILVMKESEIQGILR